MDSIREYSTWGKNIECSRAVHHDFMLEVREHGATLFGVCNLATRGGQ